MAKTDAFFIVQQRTYLDRDGRICSRTDKRRASLLSGAGGKIPMQRAIALGLANPDGTAIENSVSVDSAAPTAAVDITTLVSESGEISTAHTASDDTNDGEDTDEQKLKHVPAPPFTKAVKKPESTKAKPIK